MKNNKVYEMLMPLFDTVNAVEKLIDENNALQKENEYLKKRVKWFDESLEKNAKASGEAIHTFISACLDGRIEVKDNKTIIHQ